MADPTLVIADDHLPTRQVVRDILEGAGFRVVGEAADAQTAVGQALATRPDVALLDVHMPGNGVTAAEQIAVPSPRQPWSC